MSVNVIYKMHDGMMPARVIPQPNADGARITNDNGEFVDVLYDADAKCWAIMPSCRTAVHTADGITTLEKI